MAFTKIQQSDVANKGVIGLPDTPAMTTTAIQQKFDELALDVLMPKHNALIDELEAGAAGASIGVKDANNEDTTLQAQLDAIAAGGYTKEEADEKFETITGASETYLSQEDAASTYLSLEDASDDYLTKSDASDTYLSQTSASSTYLSQSDASDTYLSKTDAASTYYTQASATTDLAGKADVSSVPTKVSDLTNDSGYITSSALPTKVSDLTNDAGYVTSSAIPTKVSDLTNDSRYIKNSFKTINIDHEQSIVASREDTIELLSGSNITITADSYNKRITIASTGGGQSSGDMLASDYDSDSTVKNAGGIVAYINDVITDALTASY